LQFSESNKKQDQLADCGNVTTPDNLATKAMLFRPAANYWTFSAREVFSSRRINSPEVGQVNNDARDEKSEAWVGPVVPMFGHLRRSCGFRRGAGFCADEFRPRLHEFTRLGFPAAVDLAGIEPDAPAKQHAAKGARRFGGVQRFGD
jgi:hypothetical protein